MLLLLGSAAQNAARPALATPAAHRALFDDDRASFFGVTIDPADAAAGRIPPALPGLRWFLDYDRHVSIAYGAAGQAHLTAYTPHWLLLDPMLRVHARAALEGGETIMNQLRASLAAAAEPGTAPVLVVPGIFPPELCCHLIDLYETVTDESFVAVLKGRLSLVLAPMIRRAFQFDPTRIERVIVACYGAEQGGHFRAHRDNTTAGTVHRRFACTINLNAEAYDGGDLCFPEFGRRTYRAPTGGAVIFSCSLLHEARPVTKGRRYAVLPFFYDDAGAQVRENNLARVTPDLQNYPSGLPA